MAPRKPAPKKPPPKKSRKVMTLAEKIQILDKLRAGMRAAALARSYRVNESTIRTIRASEFKIRASVEASAPLTAKVSQVPRRIPHIEKMEKMLIAWLNDLDDRDQVADGNAIRDKARALYEEVIASQAGDCAAEFQASKGWLANFTRRCKMAKQNEATQREHADKFKFHFLEMDVKFESEEDPLEACGEHAHSKTVLTADILSDFIDKANELAEIGISMDPNIERSFFFKKGLDDLLSPYKKLMRELRDESGDM